MHKQTKKLRNYTDTKVLIKVILKMDLITSTSDDEREEEEMHQEREHRWAKTHLRWDVVRVRYLWLVNQSLTSKTF